MSRKYVKTDMASRFWLIPEVEVTADFLSAVKKINESKPFESVQLSDKEYEAFIKIRLLPNLIEL